MVNGFAIEGTGTDVILIGMGAVVLVIILVVIYFLISGKRAGDYTRKYGK
jgi:uncharacterized membrane protein